MADNAFNSTAAQAEASTHSLSSSCVPSTSRMTLLNPPAVACASAEPTLSTAGFQIIEEPAQSALFGIPAAGKSAVQSAGSTLRMVGVRAGETVTKGLTSSLVAQRILSLRTVACSSFGTAPAKMAAAQVSSGLRTALAVVRIPLSNGGKLKSFVDCVGKYAVANSASVSEVSQLSIGTAALFSLEANIVGALVAGAVQESLEIGRYVMGSCNSADLQHTTIAIAVSAGGSLVGGASGAALGTLLFPGAGTALGSLMGSYMGCYLASWKLVPNKPKSKTEEFDDLDEPLDSKSILAPPSKASLAESHAGTEQRFLPDGPYQPPTAVEASAKTEGPRPAIKLEKASDDWILVSQINRGMKRSASSREQTEGDDESRHQDESVAPPSMTFQVPSSPNTAEEAGNATNDDDQPDEATAMADRLAEINQLLETAGPDELVIVYECTNDGDEDPAAASAKAADPSEPAFALSDASASRFQLHSRQWRALPDSPSPATAPNFRAEEQPQQEQ